MILGRRMKEDFGVFLSLLILLGLAYFAAVFLSYSWGSAYGQSVPVWLPNLQFKIGSIGEFLVQSRCPDGSPPNNCDQPYQMTDAMSLTWHKRDWPGPYDGLFSDSVWTASGGVLSTFSVEPDHPWVPPNDGGDIYGIDTSVDPVRVLVLKTQTGDIPHPYYFIGANCGGTGWVLFDAALPVLPAYYYGGNAKWRSVTAQIGQADSPSGCAPLSPAFTQYHMELVDVPFIIFGTHTTLRIPTIISEHYDGPSPSQSVNLERFWFALGWGKIRWDFYSADRPSRGDISGACPRMPPWDYVPPFPGAQLTDCRVWTNITAADGSFKLNQYGWGWP